MRRFIAICLVLALFAVGTYIVVKSPNDNLKSTAPAVAGTASSQATTPAASEHGDAVGARHPSAPNLPAIVDGKLPPGAYRPPVFRALPEGLNGRQLRDIHDELVKAAESGDAAAAYKLATLVDECEKGMHMVEEIRQKKPATLSTNPVTDIWLKDQYAVMAVQCPQLSETELGAAGQWMLRAAKGGDRKPLLRLVAFPPDVRDPDYEAEKLAWQETLVSGLDTLAQTGDSESAITLAHYFHVQRGLSNLKSAYKYFDVASKGDGSSSRIEYALKMRDHLASEIAREERGGG